MLPSLYYDSLWEEIELSEDSLELAGKFDLSSYLVQHLLGLFSREEDIEDFLDPRPEPGYIPGTTRLARILDQAIKEKKTLLLFGDYDVDGLSSVALMKNFLELNGVEALHYIPSRYREGYGLSMEAIDLLPPTELVITFDCGITSVEEVAYLKKKGIEVLITDHHEPGEKLPDCPIINPKLEGNFRDLAGVGVAYKLSEFLSKEMGYIQAEESLVYAMLGTISDLMPLVGENRYIAKKGLELFEKTNHPGLAALRGLIKGQASAQDIAFKIGPMLNAAGRLGEAEEALELLLGQGDLTSLIEKLLLYNEERKSEENSTVEEALAKVDPSQKLIVVEGRWKKGVLGLAASRISSKYRKPTIILDESLSGSSRSLGNFSIIDALKHSSEYLSHYGGHKMAAGLKIKEGRLEDFKESITTYAQENFDFIGTRKKIPYISLQASDINLRLLDEVEKLSPYGIGNPQINFYLDNLEFIDFRKLGKAGKAFLLNFKSQDRRFDFLSFRSDLTELEVGRKYRVIFTVEKDVFRDILSIKLLLRDLRPQEPLLESSNLFLPFYGNLASSIAAYRGENRSFQLPLYEEKRIYNFGDREFPESFPHPGAFQGQARELLEDLPDREDLVKIYSWLKRQKGEFSWSMARRPFLAMVSLLIFEELELINYTNKDGSCSYNILDKDNKIDLDKSPTFRKIKEIKEDMNESY